MDGNELVQVTFSSTRSDHGAVFGSFFFCEGIEQESENVCVEGRRTADNSETTATESDTIRVGQAVPEEEVKVTPDVTEKLPSKVKQEIEYNKQQSKNQKT